MSERSEGRFIRMEHDGVIGKEEMDAVMRVMRSNHLWLYNGEETAAFEEEYARYVGSRYAVFFFNATIAMECALAAAGIGPGDKVITTPFTFIATQTAILRCNAIPIFADIDPRTFNIDPRSVEKMVTPRTKAVMAVSLFGHPIDSDPLMEIGEKHGILIMDDAAQSIGARYKGRVIGSCVDVTITSFTSPKAITSGGEGGMVTSDDEGFVERLRMIRAFGYDRLKCLPLGQLRYDMLGWNARPIELQSAIGREQLKKLERFNGIRRQHAKWYYEMLGDLDGVTLPHEAEYAWHVYWQYTIRVDGERCGVSRDELREELKASGIATDIYYDTPNYRQPYFQTLTGHGGTHCPFKCPWYKGEIDYTQVYLSETEKACKEVLSIPIHNKLQRSDIERVAEEIRGIILHL